MNICSPGRGSRPASLHALPKSPVTINVVDVAGNLALTQDAIEAYQKAHPNLVSRFSFTRRLRPSCPAS